MLRPVKKSRHHNFRICKSDEVDAREISKIFRIVDDDDDGDDYDYDLFALLPSMEVFEMKMLQKNSILFD
uniref:Transposase n=1 Tax=Romanomermis culicivorax TaxID=13658 RepID=A0A915IIP4_ROMCU